MRYLLSVLLILTATVASADTMGPGGNWGIIEGLEGGGAVYGDLDMQASHIESSTVCLKIGGDATDTFSLGVGGVCINDTLGANGKSYYNDDLYLRGSRLRIAADDADYIAEVSSGIGLYTNAALALHIAANNTVTFSDNLERDGGWGEAFVNANATATTIAVSSTWYEVDVLAAGALDDWTFSGNALQCPSNCNGTYLVAASISSSSAAVNQTFEFAISVDDVIKTNCHSERKYSTAGDVGSQSLTCILTLAATNEVKLEVQNVTTANDITIRDCNLSVTKLN